jgi:alcohol dehydrogenase, propanol-preferring
VRTDRRRRTREHAEVDRRCAVAPTAGPGEVVVDVRAAGLYHSDVGILEDEKWLAGMTPPVVPGHETAGVISELGGEGVTGWEQASAPPQPPPSRP